MLVLWSLVLSPVCYGLYHIITFLLNRRRKAKALSHLPCPANKHWLFGHLKCFVSMILYEGYLYSEEPLFQGTHP